MLEIPPPPAPSFARASFQTRSAGGGPIAVSLVPPTPVTKGWDTGSWTVSSFRRLLNRSHASEPVSPAAAKTEMPSVAACSKTVFSLAISPGLKNLVTCSHSP